MGHWLWVHVGIDGTGPWYAFWSGFGSDLTEFAIIGGLVTLVRHHNCHVKGCWALGRKVDGTPFVACHTHHPMRDNGPRNVTEQTIKDAIR